MQILLVEDEPLIQRALYKFISARGHTVITTVSGVKAAELVRSQQLDLVITDLMLSDISGIDLLREIYSLKGKDFLIKNCIAMSAYSSNEILNQISSLQVRFIPKPFNDIKLTIDYILSNESS